MNGRVMIWIIIIVGILLAIFLFTRGSKQNLPNNNQEVSIIFEKSSEPLPNINVMKQAVIRSEQEWKDIMGSPSSIDFSTKTALLVAMGQRMNGGYGIEILSVIQKEGKINVAVDMISPGKNCITTQVVNYPSVLLLIPKTDKEVNWIITNTIKDCPQ